MNRRRFLVSAGTGLTVLGAGCLSDGDLGGTDGPDDDGERADDEDEQTDDEDDDTDDDTDEWADEEPIPEEPRIDEPPYPIDRPEPPDDHDDSDWNEDYLGEELPTEPSLSFEPVSVGRGLVDGPRLDAFDREQYWVELVETETQRDERFDLDGADEETRQRLEAVDFEESVLVVVETGFGSGSVSHRWGRVEDAADGLHLHGYYTDPYIQTDDITTWLSVLEVERPQGSLDLARCTVTVTENRRVHFNSTEGVVSVGDPD